MANRYQPISHSMYIDLGGPMKFGLLGRTLGHSFSPHIHSVLGNTNYELFEREPSQLQEFFDDTLKHYTDYRDVKEHVRSREEKVDRRFEDEKTL